MGFLGHVVKLLGILACLFGVVAAGLCIAAYGTWALQNPGEGPLPLSPGPALALVLLGFLLLAAMLLVVNARAEPGDRRRYGAWAFAAGLPDIVIAWSYIAALVAPALIDARPELMAAMLAVEFFAAYTTIMLVSLSETGPRREGHAARLAAKAGVIAVTLAFVIAGSVRVGSWVPVAGYVALAGKRILMGLLEPERTAQSLSEHQYHRCMLPLCVLCFIGVPLFFVTKSVDALLLLGVLNFAFMALLEMALHAKPVRASAARLYTDADAHWGSQGETGGRHRRG
jgi:hypothetical protein